MTLDELQKLCDEATPGPWVRSGSLPQRQEFDIQCNDDNWITVKGGSKNAEFIAAARTAMPKLIAVAKAARLLHHSDMCNSMLKYTNLVVGECDCRLNEVHSALAALEESNDRHGVGIQTDEWIDVPLVKEPRKAREFIIFRRKDRLGYFVDHIGTVENALDASIAEAFIVREVMPDDK